MLQFSTCQNTPICFTMQHIIPWFYCFFCDNVLQVANNESGKAWKTWFDSEAPEDTPIPDGYQGSLDTFRKLLLIRAWCPDRTINQARRYITDAIGKEVKQCSYRIIFINSIYTVTTKIQDARQVDLCQVKFDFLLSVTGLILSLFVLYQANKIRDQTNLVSIYLIKSIVHVIVTLGLRRMAQLLMFFFRFLQFSVSQLAYIVCGMSCDLRILDCLHISQGQLELFVTLIVDCN